MTIVKDGNGVLIRDRVVMVGLSTSSYKQVYKDGVILLKGSNYCNLDADINRFNKYLKRC